METPANKKILLVVEDDSDLKNVLVDRLKTERHYEVFSASDGEEAVSLLVDKRPHLVLLDLLLPKLDGFKVLERLRSYPDKEISGAKVVVLSNMWSNKDILRARALKIEDYFVKANSNLEDVVAKINVLLLGQQQL